MSRLKNPEQKKLASLALDRRNVYGENDKASRKLIPKSKQKSHQSLRRSAKRPLLNPELLVDDDSANIAEFKVQSALIIGKRKGFKKQPDAPLGAVLRAKVEPYLPSWQGGDRLVLHREILDPKKREIDRSRPLGPEGAQGVQGRKERTHRVEREPAMFETKPGKSDLKIPAFATEAEEAKWWFDNQDIVFEEFKKAAKAGTLGRGGARRLFAERGIPFPEPQPLPTTTIRLDLDDIAKARVQAAERGLRYQTYLKMIIHEALREAERKAAAS